MKILFIIISLMYFSSGTILKAQDADTDPRGNIAFGIKAGLNYSNVWDEKVRPNIKRRNKDIRGAHFNIYCV